jgi:NADP-dependent 3-hydroxy acid dehydrogenase YdfG
MPKVILISGGSDGLGKAIAEKLVPNHHVVILAHNLEKLEAAAKELNCSFVEAELTDYNSMQKAVNQVIERHHGLDVLVNCAGIWMEGELDDNDPRKIKELIDVNTTGTILLTKAVLSGMRFRRSGQIINIISQDGLCAKKSRSVYHASKWAITGFTKCLQEDLENEKINITAVYPGLIKTGLFEKSGVKRDLSDALDPKEVASLVEYVINLSPSTQVTEVSIKNKKISQNMDDNNSPAIDLNIDPDMITPDGGTPQAMPQNPQPVSAPTPPVKNPSVIDITPGSTDAFPTTPPVSTHIDSAPLSAPKTVDITPPFASASAPALTNMPDSLSHLSQIAPEETPEPVVPLQAPPSAPVTPNTIPDGNFSDAPAPAIQHEPITQSSPLAEDPDLVKLIK